MFSFTIQYQTAEIVPAPFAHAIEIKGKNDGDGNLDINFNLEYLGREELSEEEIFEEGFTLNDNFNWIGKLPTIWLEFLFGTLKTMQIIKKDKIDEHEEYWQIGFEGQQHYPKDPVSWKRLLEELQQAIFETAEYEKPLNLTFLNIQDKSISKIRLEASFQERKANWVRVSPLRPSTYLAWHELQPTLKNIFCLDFLPELAQNKEPNRNGNYLNLGDDLWYEIGKSAVGGKKQMQKVVQLATN